MKKYTKQIIRNDKKAIKDNKKTAEFLDLEMGRVWQLDCANADQLRELEAQQSDVVKAAEANLEDKKAARDKSYAGYLQGKRARTPVDYAKDHVARGFAMAGTAAIGVGTTLFATGTQFAGAVTAAAGLVALGVDAAAGNVGKDYHNNKIANASKELETEKGLQNDIENALAYKVVGKEFVKDNLEVKYNESLDNVSKSKSQLSTLKYQLKTKHAPKAKSEEHTR